MSSTPNALLGRGAEFEGKLTFEGTVHIEGRFKGEIFSEGTLVVGEGAEVHAEIRVGSVVIQGNVVGNVYIRKVEREEGRLVNTVIQTYPNVSQFWTYKPEEFLKNPVYSRDWPPAKNLES